MSALADYYSAMAAEKYAGIPLQKAQAELTSQQASVVDPNAAAARALQGAQANLNNQQASVIVPNSTADINQKDALTGGERARNSTILPAFDLSQQGTGIQQQLSALGLGGTGITLDSIKSLLNKAGGSPAGYGGAEKGTSKIKPSANGKPGKTDTVPMMLAPGEAVLNKGAVDHYGTGVIGHMNKMGLMRGKAHKEVAGHFKKMAGRKG